MSLKAQYSAAHQKKGLNSQQRSLSQHRYCKLQLALLIYQATRAAMQCSDFSTDPSNCAL